MIKNRLSSELVDKYSTKSFGMMTILVDYKLTVSSDYWLCSGLTGA